MSFRGVRPILLPAISTATARAATATVAAAAAATAAEAAAAAATTAATGAGTTLFSLVDAQGTTVEVGAVHLGDRLLGALRSGHRHEGEAARAAGLAVEHELGLGHVAALREETLNGLLGG